MHADLQLQTCSAVPLGTRCHAQQGSQVAATQRLHTGRLVQWSEDMIKADPFFGRSRDRFRVTPWISNTIACDHLALHRRRPCELRAVV